VRYASLELPDEKEIRKGCEPSKEKTSKTGVKQQPTFDLLPLHLEGTAPGLNRPLEAPDGLALLLEGQLLAGARDAEHHQLALDLGELNVPVLQRHLRCLTTDALPLQGRSSVGKSGLLLLEPPLSPLAGGTLLQELVLGGGERRDLGVEGGPQVVGLLGLLLGRARPLLGLALLSLRLLERRVEPPVVAVDTGHLRLPVGRQDARILQVRPRLPQRLIPVDEGRADPLEAGGACRVLPCALVELIAQDHGPVRQPAVRGPEGVGERIEGAAPLPELLELGGHLVEGAVLVASTALELLSPTSQNP
jgi:hypothetical protein